MKKNIHDYSDIMDIERPTFNINRMSVYDRAAQFAPFAALTGHQDAVDEVARLTEKKQELSENYKDLLDYKLIEIIKNINQNSIVKVTYFKNDLKKSGGEYITQNLKIKKLDFNSKKIIFEDKFELGIRNIIDIELIKK